MVQRLQIPATVIKRDHPIFRDFPHGGYCGWQFRRLMEGGRAVQLEAGIPFDPIVDVASSVKNVIRQAARLPRFFRRFAMQQQIDCGGMRL